MAVMGELFDYAIRELEIEGEVFCNYFINSSVCQKLENGEPRYLLGKSGPELAYEILEEITGEVPKQNPGMALGRSPEYWCGWSLCFCQWDSGRSYRDILLAVPYDQLFGLYPTLHEADVTKVAEIVREHLKLFYSETNLKRIRKAYGCTQKELAAWSGVTLRSIQMYEERGKDINKAQAASLYALAKTLGCTMEDLLEKS